MDKAMEAAALVERLEGGETGREIDSPVWFILFPEYRQWGGPYMFVPKDEPDYFGWNEMVGRTRSAENYVAHGIPLSFNAQTLKIETASGEPFTGDYRKHPYRAYVPKLTTSLDAAVALVERVRPGAHWGIQWYPGFEIEASASINPKVPSTPVNARAPTPAAALVAALLKARAALSALEVE